ncbi:MAG: hypothetical protein WCS93_04555 [Candidatus Delongbacteria bacterium]
MRKAVLFILTLTLMTALESQSLLKIHHADLLKQDIFGGKIIYGNIDIEYDVYRVKCDSAVINKDMTNARLFKNIQFSDTARTIKCRTATLSKTPNGNLAYLSGDVSIKEKDFYITGKDASLNEISERLTVTDSVMVRYYEFPSILYCSGLEMDTKNNIITSQSVDSVLSLDSLRHYKLYTKRFRYELDRRTLTIDTKMTLHAYEDESPSPKFQIIDPGKIARTVKNLNPVKKGYFEALGGKFSFDPFIMQTQGKCFFQMTDSDDPDTLSLSSDKITYDETTVKGTAEGKVKIRKGKMNINAGLAKYFGNESTAKFYDDPVVTYEMHKVEGDSMTVISEKGDINPEKAVIYGKPRYESVPDSLRPEEMNILTGKLMNIWFSDNEINKIIVSKEAEGVYFISREKDKAPDASNYLLGDEIELNFSDGEVKSASITGGCEGIYYPDKLKLNALKKKKK